MKKLLKIVAAAAGLLIVASALTGCTTAEPIDMTQVAAVVDVRTPAEWATGHLDGAVNIDIQGADFATKIDALDHAANYVVYCHSGNRAGQAVDYMKGAGFTGTLTNAGGVVNASKLTNLKVVQ